MLKPSRLDLAGLCRRSESLRDEVRASAQEASLDSTATELRHLIPSSDVCVHARRNQIKSIFDFLGDAHPRVWLDWLVTRALNYRSRMRQRRWRSCWGFAWRSCVCRPGRAGCNDAESWWTSGSAVIHNQLHRPHGLLVVPDNSQLHMCQSWRHAHKTLDSVYGDMHSLLQVDSFQIGAMLPDRHQAFIGEISASGDVKCSEGRTFPSDETDRFVAYFAAVRNRQRFEVGAILHDGSESSVADVFTAFKV